jgi:predicted nucleotidyltransferase
LTPPATLISPFCRFNVREEDIRPLDAVLIGEDTLAIVVRRLAPGELLVVPKYSIMWEAQQARWRLAGLGLGRLLRTYSPRSVWRSVRASGVEVSWSPIFSSKIPVATVQRVRMHCGMKPGSIANHLTYLTSYSKAIVDLYTILSPVASCLRLTGSLLYGSFIEGVSDVDVVVDVADKRCLEKLYDHVPELEKHGLPESLAAQYIAREAAERSIELNIIASIYRRWSRLYVGGVQASITIVDSAKRMETPKFLVKPLSQPTKAIVKVEPLEYTLADFPAVAETREGIILVVYDGIYVPALLEGGRFEVRGLRAEYTSPRLTGEALVVGVAEEPTYIRYVGGG